MGRERSHWYQDAIFYEIQLRAFADSNADGIGDFAGLTSRLDYLADLGVTAIWLTPFYPSPLRDGGYDISDYVGVHPDYGTTDDFVRFLDAAHRRGLRVIIELVLNHTSSAHPWFQRARRAPAGSDARDFYVWSDTTERYGDARVIFKDFEASNWTWDPVAKAYYWHRFYAHQPDLNYDHPAVHQAILEVVDHWFALGVDGARLDAIPYLYEREGTSSENLPETHAFLKKLRAHVDARYPDRMLLAEANQWPADAAAYFGDGDECHMNFHFPLMPRLFMAVQLEDSFPIVDILAQTPAIPASCQWATFLRNHDELTLEMVTEEDRDYMVRVYAPDHRARINLGIRRRLAPLLGDRRRLELLNAILFALPGTPVLYYGDEIGMGDNIYLGDRDGVRTPMQWSGERNAGFSQANPQRLFLPVIVDPPYHYEAVNVEAQEADPSSLLWWMKYLIHQRRSRPVLGRGALRFVEHDNAKVLAFVREHGDERILFVANLSRFAQYTALRLSDHRGARPVELDGRARFPVVGAEPWGISLGPYGHLSFDLSTPEAAAAGEREPLVIEGEWWRVAAPPAEGLARRIATFLRGRRWFRGPCDPATPVVRDAVPLEVGDARFVITLTELERSEAPGEMYVVPIGYLKGELARETQRARSRLLVSPLLSSAADETRAEAGILVDPTSDAAYSRRLLEALTASERVEGIEGALQFTALDGLAGVVDGGDLALERAELDETVRFFGSRVVLKMLRAVDDGVNAEEEMLRFLSRRAGRLSPRLLGTITWRSRAGAEVVVGLATELVKSRGTARALFSDALQAYRERALARVGGPALERRPPPPEATPSDAWEALAEPLPSLVDLLARRTAELHEALASDREDPSFCPEPFDVLHRQSLHQSARSHLSRALGRLKRELPSLGDADLCVATQLFSLEPELLAAFHDIVEGEIEAARIRTHGDLELREVLFTGDDFVFISFEGEPTRSLRERRFKRCCLRDAAGIVASIEEVAERSRGKGRVRPGDRARVAPWVDAWSTRLGARYLETYLRALEGSGLVPEDPRAVRRLVRFYLLERGVAAVTRALDGRGELALALGGLRRSLGRPTS